jgi:N6-adenosine-specific RNA methylase IME4
MIPLPPGPFACILADPPWGFRTRSGTDVTPHRTDVDHYDTLTHDQLLALPVNAIAAPDCALFMWVVDSHLEMALELGRTWGFTYRTRAFSWLKMKNDFSGSRMGMGYWTRKETEFCLLFGRGQPPRLSRGVREVIFGDTVAAPRREHSRKPDEQYERIEQLCAGPRLEMFARQHREGWEAWGDQVDRFPSDPIMELIG